MTVNDGKGLYDNIGLCDTLIENINNLLKNMAAGQYIRVCSITMEMVQKLTNLKKNIKTETDSMEKVISELTERCNSLTEQMFGDDQKQEGNNGADGNVV
jgi:predicted RNase H-like nuclease (RuvC/YqgF family)